MSEKEGGRERGERDGADGVADVLLLILRGEGNVSLRMI